MKFWKQNQMINIATYSYVKNSIESMISYDVTATIVIYQNNQMAAVSISFKFLTYADTLLCIKLLLGSWPRE